MVFPEHHVRFIAVNDGVDSERGENEFTPFRNILNAWYVKDTSTIVHMLSRQEYLGHTVNFKTYRKSYKQKKQIKNDPSEWQVFENTHEAIIDRDF